MRHLIIISLCILTSNLVLGSCYEQRYLITEILANEKDEHHIFTCYIHETFNGGFVSIAIVKDIFRGRPNDTVRINTGGLTTMGGTQMKLGVEWLIISSTNDNYQYSAAVCHNLSIPLTEHDVGCAYPQRIYGEDYIKLIEDYQRVRQRQFSGNKVFYLKDSIVAKGFLNNGSADGIWQHYNYSHRLEKQQLELETEYKSGVLSGISVWYVRDYEPQTLDKKLIIEDGKTIFKQIRNIEFSHCSFEEKGVEKIFSYTLNENRDTVSIVNEVSEIQFSNQQFYAVYKHGRYLSLVDYSEYKKPCSGQYYKGAKVGEWEYYDRHGNVAYTEFYNHPAEEDNKFIKYYDDGSPKVVATLRNNMIVGRVTYYYDDKLATELYYDNNSQLTTGIQFFDNLGSRITSYENGQKHGEERRYDMQDKLVELTTYKNGIREGEYMKWSESGDLICQSVFNRGIETTIFRNDGQAYLVKGSRNGYHVQRSIKDGKVMHEGEYWMGYSIGKHISYKKNGGYSIAYFSTNKEVIMNDCNNGYLKRREFYNKEGELIRKEDY